MLYWHAARNERGVQQDVERKHMQSEVNWAYLATAIVAAVAGWLVAFWRFRSTSAALVTSAKAQAEIEIATTRERLRAGEEQAVRVAARLQAVEDERRHLRDELDQASNDIARLGERASRVAGLELELQQSRQQAQQAEAAGANLR